MKGLVLTAFSKFFSDELKAWFVWLSKKCRRVAVSKLPESVRERYREEWESSAEELPGEIVRLIYSIGLLRAAAGIRETILFNNVPAINRSKRLLDVLFSAAVLYIFAVPLLAIAVALKLETPGPVLIPVWRVGRGGKRFATYRLRTTGFYGSEMRVTRVGRFLRVTSLYYIPVFYSVLRGDMSLIGPYAPLPRFSESLPENVTPGIVNYKGEPEYLQADWSLSRDIQILWRTVRMLLQPLRK